MVNRSDRDLSTLPFVRAQFHEAVEMIRDSDSRISIMATGNFSPDQKAEYVTATLSLFSFSTSCSRAGSIYDNFPFGRAKTAVASFRTK